MASKLLSDESAAIRVTDIYGHIRKDVLEDNFGKFVAIDLNTGLYCIDSSYMAAVDKLEAEQPSADIFAKRIGYDTAMVIGASWHRDDVAKS